MTTLERAAHRQALLDAMRYGGLLKPVDLQDLLDCSKRFLGSAKASQEELLYAFQELLDAHSLYVKHTNKVSLFCGRHCWHLLRFSVKVEEHCCHCGELRQREYKASERGVQHGPFLGQPGFASL